MDGGNCLTGSTECERMRWKPKRQPSAPATAWNSPGSGSATGPPCRARPHPAETQARARPRVLDDLALHLQLVGVVRMLQLAAPARAEIRARPVTRAATVRSPDTTLATGARAWRPRGSALHHLPGQRIADGRDLAVFASNHRAATAGAVGLRSAAPRGRDLAGEALPELDHLCRRGGSPLADLVGAVRVAPYWTAWPDLAHQRTTKGRDTSLPSLVVFTSITRPVRPRQPGPPRISGSKSFSLYGGEPSGQ